MNTKAFCIQCLLITSTAVIPACHNQGAAQPVQRDRTTELLDSKAIIHCDFHTPNGLKETSYSPGEEKHRALLVLFNICPSVYKIASIKDGNITQHSDEYCLPDWFVMSIEELQESGHADSVLWQEYRNGKRIIVPFEAGYFIRQTPNGERDIMRGSVCFHSVMTACRPE